MTAVRRRPSRPNALNREWSAGETEMSDPMGDINPGNSIQVKVAFDVPPGTPTEGAVLEMHDSTLSGGVQAMRRSRTASARRSSVTISASFACMRRRRSLARVCSPALTIR